MKQVLIVLPVNERHKERLEQAGNGCRFDFIPSADVTEEDVKGADIIIGNVTPGYIAQSKRLQFLQLNSAGAEAYTAPGVLAADTVLANARGAYGKAVGEHMFALAMTLQKKLHRYRDDKIAGAWKDYGVVTSMSDATVLVIGLGDIGLYFGGIAKAMGAYVIGIKRKLGSCPEEVDELYTMEELEMVVPKADVILSVLPDTPKTQGIYSFDFFKMMKRTAIFLNGGRGTAVDQEALLWALRNQEILAAGVDVTDPEPLPPDHPLWQEPDLFITPHISGQYHLPETLDKIVEIAAGNLEAFLCGEPLKNIIEFQ